MNTIAAIATPIAEGGISVIRISGDKAAEIAEKVFVPAGNTKVSEMAGYTACYGEIRDGETRLDDGVLLIYRAPRSYTGEEVQSAIDMLTGLDDKARAYLWEAAGKRESSNPYK